MVDSKDFWVSNPSAYKRSDYVEVDLSRLDVPEYVDQTRLRLLRIDEDGSSKEIPYQIDDVFGRSGHKRYVTFLSEDTPAGRDDYDIRSARFSITLDKPRDPSLFVKRDKLWIGHYYREPKPGEPSDGFRYDWDESREVDGVKIANDKLEAYISLVPRRGLQSDVDYTGSTTSIKVTDKSIPEAQEEPENNLLNPFDQFPQARWGQMTHLGFFPLPWESRTCRKISLLNTSYKLVWSNSGPMRAIFTMKSEPFTLEFQADPILKTANLTVSFNLYRVYYIYLNKPFYIEELFVRTEDGHPLNFRPYYQSQISPVRRRFRWFKRLDHVPDYFLFWHHFAVSESLAFAADAHVQKISIDGDRISWEHPFVNRLKSTHLFMIENPFFPLDPLFNIGRYGWYESLYKPLELFPLGEKYYSLELD